MSHFPSRSLLLHPILSVSQPEHPSYIPPLFHTTSLHTNLLQTNDLATQLHHALFELDGGFGYVLKPPELRGGVSSGGGGLSPQPGPGAPQPGEPAPTPAAPLAVWPPAREHATRFELRYHPSAPPPTPSL